MFDYHKGTQKPIQKYPCQLVYVLQFDWLEDIYVIHRLGGLCWEKLCRRSCFIFFLLRLKKFQENFPWLSNLYVFKKGAFVLMKRAIDCQPKQNITTWFLARLACELQKFFLAHRRWGIREEQRLPFAGYSSVIYIRALNTVLF